MARVWAQSITQKLKNAWNQVPFFSTGEVLVQEFEEIYGNLNR
jgi:hypothetical protein